MVSFSTVLRKILLIVAIFCSFYVLYLFGLYKNYTINFISKLTMNKINDINVRNPKIHKSYINIFDSKRFEEVEKHDTQANNTCVQTRLKVIDKY